MKRNRLLRFQVLKQQADGVRGLLPSKQQQAQQSRIKVETMRDSLWEAEEAAIQAKAKLDEIEAAVRATFADFTMECFCFCVE